MFDKSKGPSRIFLSYSMEVYLQIYVNLYCSFKGSPYVRGTFGMIQKLPFMTFHGETNLPSQRNMKIITMSVMTNRLWRPILIYCQSLPDPLSTDLHTHKKKNHSKIQCKTSRLIQ